MMSKEFDICGIPFVFLYFKNNKAMCRLGDSHQIIDIPKKYFKNDGTLSCNSNELIWVLDRKDVMYKMRKALNEI